MAIDGSFRVEAALERLLARCPKLGSVPGLISLSQKGSELTEEEVLGSIAELFLHPNYTIPIMGCFRAIARDIVDKAVALLRLVPDLRSNSDDPMEEGESEITRKHENFNYEDVINLIEFHVRSGRGLKLHELSCLAFCRALDLAPFLLGCVLCYFEFAPPPFERVLVTDSALQSLRKGCNDLFYAVRASYRLLLIEPEVFSKLWEWSCFLDLMQQFAIVNLENTSDSPEMVLDIKWCAIQILLIILKLSDRATVNFRLRSEESLTCLLRWEEFCQDVSVEKAGWYLGSSELEKGDSLDVNVGFNLENYLQSLGLKSLAITSSDGHKTESKRKNGMMQISYAELAESPFVLTSAVKKSFEMVVLAVSQKWPVLLYGPAGSGKTALIKKLAQYSGNRVLTIHMDEQIDGKTLIGSYVCTEQPGEFRWQPGSLTQAVLNGFWVVFENIDKAPSDVHSILLPLLEGASSILTGRGEAVRVAESFRLFSTISSMRHDASHNSEGRVCVGMLWRKVMVGYPSKKDLLDIVNAWYPNLESISEKLVGTFDMVATAVKSQFLGFGIANRFSLRDLLKWCKRITCLGFSFVGRSLYAYECRSIYQEAVDIFAASLVSPEARLEIMKGIGKIWVPVSDTEILYPFNNPVVQDLNSVVQVGRVTLGCNQAVLRNQKRPFVGIRSSLHVLERIACSVKCNEPVLLVGETGTGKTTLVQNLAMRLGQPVNILNLSQQSDIADLLGGFKPTDARFICIPLYNEFLKLFSRTFSIQENQNFLAYLGKHVSGKDWKMLLNGLQRGLDFFQKHAHVRGGSGHGTKRKRPLGTEVIEAWEKFSMKLDISRRQIGDSAGMAFSFVEGAFVTALRNGHWILLDEVNLAPPETLQRIIGVLEGETGSLCLAERGDVDYVDRHPNFRVFACMNPATDAGKRNLPYSLRSRFTEYFVDDVLNDDDLTLFINQFMGDDCRNRELVKKIVCFYKAAKKESEVGLQDGANQKPQFSLRSLYRALEYMKKAERKFGLQKAIYDGFCMFFVTLLDKPSAKLMNSMVVSCLLGGNLPPSVPFDNYLVVRQDSKDTCLESYVLTKSVKGHLENLARTIFIKRYPVLLQGPTSSGKTSLVRYLAAVTGHEFVRINNHEHTDLQEYLGSYITDASGKLVFQEGVLVKAVRNGFWVVLDELNLAPSDVLEALNRLLDDNRELFVPELQETVPAHPDFMLFATQNPPNFYGGRKMLSRAFRNRFVEIHVDEIPADELSTILEKRCEIPESYAKKMVEVMKELQLHRQSSKIFAGKHGFITPRDLFKWAERFRLFGNSYEDLATDGYFILAERLRDAGEKEVVQDVLERLLKVKLLKNDLYMEEPAGGGAILKPCDSVKESLGNIILTESMQRLCFLIERCYRLREPVLLVGETGGGKTTVCQLLSKILRSKLHIMNCHQYTEASDFIGGFYPIRDRSRLNSEFKYLVEQLMLSKAYVHFPGDITLSSDICQASSTLSSLTLIINKYKEGLASHPDVTSTDLDTFEQLNLGLVELHRKWQAIFMWQDGPLVKAMKDGDLFLIDEISLADDSVLERLNSVLEPERKLSLAEKGGSELETVTAHPKFFLLATMNPGGDYGKKELSPALRNRFTEIWVPTVRDLKELRSIALKRFLIPEPSYVVDHMLKFWEWFNQLQTGRTLTVRDLLAWVDFMNEIEKKLGSHYAFIHGAFLVLLDGLILGTGISKNDAKALRRRCLSFLLGQLKLVGDNNLVDLNFLAMESCGWEDPKNVVEFSCSDDKQPNNFFGINPFYIAKGDGNCDTKGFEFLAPTTRKNAVRVLRAMQLAKPVLLEGSPGVGKTSLVVALGKFSGHRVVRINLSEQTDIMDLLGSDLPIEGEDGMKFAWSDGILLQALKEGSWVLLDELNLAPQSVLEGLNAILDHRAEVFIPELGLTFKCAPSFRVFACQNPSYQGGGRKCLPKSFLNRFMKVYVDELVEDDYFFICSSLHPSIPRPLLSKLISFNRRLYEDTMLFCKYGQDGSPWEFNLRDVIRSCQIIEGAPEKTKVDCFLGIVYIQRMRAAADRREVLQLYEQVFGVKPFIILYPRVEVNPKYLIVGDTAIERNYFQPPKISRSSLKILPGIRYSLEGVVRCVKHQWLCILVGPSSSGKTSVVRLLSQLTGNVLNELNLSSTTDISELLGCFEQYNSIRNFRLVIAQIERYMNEYFSLQLESSKEAFVTEKRDLISRWLTLLSTINYNPISSSASTFSETLNSRFFGCLDSLVEIIYELIRNLEQYHLPVSWSMGDLNRTLKEIRNLQEVIQRRTSSFKFEWVTGMLIKAIESGEWIVLKNANLCNPTVLDRINSLVESSGSITVNECGLVNGEPVVIHPHPKFRMFLTVNPKYGEISRAMRNRGVEIFMMQPYWLPDGGNGYDVKEAELKDVKRLLVLSGIPTDNLVDAMAESHVYVRDAGLRFGAHITYLEISRWVELFNQLVMSGNLPFWSLQISWEHTYLSSLGEGDGRDIVECAKNLYLSAEKLFKLDALEGCTLSLPGGWPTPLGLRDFLLYSKEASVKQNCMYLEFLGVQYGCYEFSMSHKRCPIKPGLTSKDNVETSFVLDKNQLHPSLISVQMLPHILYSMPSRGLSCKYVELPKLDLALSFKMLFFAANWTIEQATEHDFKLYLIWFSWFSSRLQPFCQFFKSFLKLLEQETNHPIWKCIIGLRRELTSHSQVDVDSHPIPILSLELVDLIASNEALKSSNRRLCNAIQSIRLLQCSIIQWTAEDEYDHSKETQCFIPLLSSLRVLENMVLNILVESSCFDLLIQSYRKLLEDHLSFWKGIVSSQTEYLLISWRSLEKDARKLQYFCPNAVETFLVESGNLVQTSIWRFRMPKSMLWVHGGHPFVPSSADMYDKLRQLICFCESHWTIKGKSCKQGNDYFVDIVLSSNPELRYLAMQGVCMATHLSDKCDEDSVQIIKNVEDIHQMLLERFEYGKHQLETFLESADHDSTIEDFTACCDFFPEILCRKSGFDGWQETLLISDSTSFFLDIELLQELSKAILVDDEELHQALSYNYKLLENVLNFSLKFSSRPPTDFSPHQSLLWVLDAWISVDRASRKVASLVLDLWCKWHSSLWIHCDEPVKKFSRINGCDIPLPYMLLQPTRTVALEHILHGKCPIKDYSVHRLKLRVASRDLWQYSLSAGDLHSILLSAAQSLFHQIIFAYRKSFAVEKFAEIKSILCSISGNGVKQDDIQTMSSLIASSSHSRLSSLMNHFIEPVLQELYVKSSSHGFLHGLGFAWIHIGGLRFHLLLNADDLDPAMKYSFKHSQLEERISLLKLEMKVRHECDHLIGRSSIREDLEQRALLLQEFEAEQKSLKRKIVFRPDPAKFKKLKCECDDFLGLVTSAIALVENLEGIDTKQLIDQACNWQETAACFISRLTNEYAAYTDITQPVQVAVYEMKLGLSIAVSSALQKEYMNKVEDNMDRILETIYSFMRFPRVRIAKSILKEVNSKWSTFPFCDLDSPLNVWVDDMHLLKKLYAIPRDSYPDKLMSVLQSDAAVHHNFLVRLKHFIANSLVLDNAAFMLLDEIFDQFANLWMKMKVQTRVKEDIESQQYKFRPRAFEIEKILEIDISALKNSFTDETLYSEWNEVLADEEYSEKAPDKEEENLEEWNLVEESILKDVVQIHNQIFGSINLVQNPRMIQVSGADQLLSFQESYMIGTFMIKDLQALFSSNLDVKLTPEHLLHLCLEHEQKPVMSYQSARIYNFYKDANAPVMTKMVKPLITLQQRIRSLLNEWEDHPGLQQLLDITEMLLDIPSSTPLSKALSGLQFLLRKAQVLQENASKFYLSDQLEPMFMIVSSWQKMELDSWPALLDEVQEQYEINAGKLWFPLYSVLHHRHSSDIDENNGSTIQSLEEFVQTSSTGEFRKRLELLYAFHGQINTGISLKSYSGSYLMKHLKLLYNIFGYYVQFLPLIMEHIEDNRRNIEAELRELLKLCRWERPESNLSMETSKRTRQKLRKLIQKFSDGLQQPVMVVINRKVAERGIRIYIRGPKLFDDIPDSSGLILPSGVGLTLLSDKDRLIWHADWKKKADFSLRNLYPRRKFKPSCLNTCFLDDEVVVNIILHSFASHSQLVYQDELEGVWHSLENICSIAVGCCNLWKDGTKNPRKRRALSDLLKLLENCGLSRHKYIFLEDHLKSDPAHRWVNEPSYDMRHLLLTQSNPSCHSIDIYDPEQFQRSSYEIFDSNWKTANQCYFKSLASVQLLRQICLNFHKDFSLEQVNRSASFLDHLLVIQQEQRDVAYSFSEHLIRLRNCTSSLKEFDTNSTTSSESYITPNQHATHKCMWKQKQIFDSLCAMLQELSLLLRTVENAHVNGCQTIRTAANKFIVFIEKFIPELQKSKESLDNYLLGSNKIITTPSASSPPHLFSKQMEQLVNQNFQMISNFEEHVQNFCRQSVDHRSVEETLLNHFGDIFIMGKLAMEEFHSDLEPRNQFVNTYNEETFCPETFSKFEAVFAESFKKTLGLIIEVFKKLGVSNIGHSVSKDSLERITLWKVPFESSISSLQLDVICDEFTETFVHARNLVNFAGKHIPNLCSQVGICLKQLHVLLDLLLYFGNGLLHEILAMHKRVAEMTHMLAEMFASLYSQGFGTHTDEQVDSTADDRSQDAIGTGMGEGVGLNDVSDQINDEDQLLGTEKPSEGQDALNEGTGKKDKGIEMDQDFAADTYSISEDSGDDIDEDDEDEKLESAMGETGDDSRVIDEKLWDRNEDGSLNDSNEKYESGPSVKDADSSSRELKAKEDDATTVDESGELNPGEFEDQNKDEQDHDGYDDKEQLDDMKIEKEDAFADPTGLQLKEPDQGLEEDMDMEGPENADTMEESGPEEHNEFGDHVDDADEKINPMDEDMEKAESVKMAENVGSDDLEKDNDEISATDLTKQKANVCELRNSNLGRNTVLNAESATQPNGEAHVAEPSAEAPQLQYSDGDHMQNGLAPTRGLPTSNIVDSNIMAPDMFEGGKLTDDQPQSQFPQHDIPAMQKTHPNPYRHVGDALEEWKRRVRVSVDLQEHNTEAPHDIKDENAEEFGYVSEFEKGTAQALGDATSNQTKMNVDINKPEGEGHTEQMENLAEMEIRKQDSESHAIWSSNSHIIKERVDEHMHNSDVNDESSVDRLLDADHIHDDRGLSASLISMKKSYVNEDILQLSNLSVRDEEMGKAKKIEGLSSELEDSALWRRYELLTTRLSQELAEQLRLVMEPTVASRLQGDYKTGKRINMKKVIPYIASHFRKDKIWLRRTRPDKRDYQVLVAVDDSRSMSESHCGDVAIEALVTVCRAMSQLEMGNIAVASFGKKGNIRMLHDFDHPFTREAGVKMISSLTFKQENTITDEPMVDLLKYLNNMLDAAVTNAYLPSGKNPLQQLVLIIADGRFHEKNLKHYVRDVLATNRMVAFLLLDNPQESIMDLTEISFEGERITYSKYLDSFPFPYYIILKSIEALPRTLADLLRQWFELMQRTRD